MDKLLPFLHENLWLAIAFIVVLIAFIVVEIKYKGGSAVRLTLQKAIALMNQKHCHVFDIRSEADFKQGHVVNAQPLDVSNPKALPDTLKKYKEHPILLVCHIGKTASSIASLLQRQGFKKAYALQGGMTAWKKEHMPITKKKERR